MASLLDLLGEDYARGSQAYNDLIGQRGFIDATGEMLARAGGQASSDFMSALEALPAIMAQSNNPITSFAGGLAVNRVPEKILDYFTTGLNSPEAQAKYSPPPRETRVTPQSMRQPAPQEIDLAALIQQAESSGQTPSFTVRGDARLKNSQGSFSKYKAPYDYNNQGELTVNGHVIPRKREDLLNQRTLRQIKQMPEKVQEVLISALGSRDIEADKLAHEQKLGSRDIQKLMASAEIEKELTPYKAVQGVAQDLGQHTDPIGALRQLMSVLRKSQEGPTDPLEDLKYAAERLVSERGGDNKKLQQELARLLKTLAQ